MKKSTRIVRKLLALFLVVLMNIESFAAVVSDNDGSAFITKAEFDSLKNDFQSQINQYNTSIDAKIDGAIASYLAGINLSKDTTYKVEIADWEEVTATNHVLPENWTMPSLNLCFAVSNSTIDPNKTWYNVWWADAKVNYSKPKDTHQVRNLVSAGVESTTNTLPDTVTWLGQSQDLEDKIVAVKMGKCRDMFPLQGTGMKRYENCYLIGATEAGSHMGVDNLVNFKLGYINGLDAESLWKAKTVWTVSSNNLSMIVDSLGTWINTNVATSIALNYVSNKQYKYQHIINLGDYNYNQLTDPTWTNTLGSNPVYLEKDVVQSTSLEKNGKWGAWEINDSHSGASDTRWTAQNTIISSGTTLTGQIRYKAADGTFSAFYSGDYGTEREVPAKSVGVLDTTYKSEKILQWSGKRKLNRDENISYEKINLYNGALIAYAKQDETFKWEPVIKGTYDNGGTDVAITKWRVKLSDKPFGTGESLGTGGKVLKNVGQTDDYLVTDDTGKCKFNFQLGENTTIWCKWWPDDTNICNNYNWKGTLDLTQCGTYTITEA